VFLLVYLSFSISFILSAKRDIIADSSLVSIRNWNYVTTQHSKTQVAGSFGYGKWAVFILAGSNNAIIVRGKQTIVPHGWRIGDGVGIRQM
jgi:hypothetical protein